MARLIVWELSFVLSALWRLLTLSCRISVLGSVLYWRVNSSTCKQKKMFNVQSWWSAMRLAWTLTLFICYKWNCEGFSPTNTLVLLNTPYLLQDTDVKVQGAGSNDIETWPLINCFTTCVIRCFSLVLVLIETGILMWIQIVFNLLR